jgi:DNA-binding transcriptional LysR family regulator
VRSASGEASGRLSLTAPSSFGVRQLMPALIAFTETYPKIRLDVSFSDRVANLLEEGFDAAIRLGRPDDSTYIARKLCRTRIIAVASPAYVDRFGAPESPSELESHECILDANFREPNVWRFRDSDDGTLRVPVSGRLRFNNGEACIAAAAAGQGIAYGPSFLAGASIRDGALRQILAAHEIEPQGAYALYPAGRHLAAKVRALIEFLVERFRGVPPWDQGW